MGAAAKGRRSEILELVARYRMVTVPAIRAALYEGPHPDAARKALTRLVSDGMLRRYVVRGRAFYQLTRRGCSMTGAPASASGPMHTQAFLERYALVCFACLHAPRLKILTPGEMKDAFPALLGAPGVDICVQHFYIDTARDSLRLARVVVDGGGSVKLISDKCRKAASPPTGSPLAEAAKRGQFMLTVLTAYETKAAALRAALEARAAAVEVRVVVVEEMKLLMGVNRHA